jgi:hypothetical protein
MLFRYWFWDWPAIVNELWIESLLNILSPPDIAQSQVGIYSACYKISIMMTIFIQAFKYAAEPFFFSNSKDKDAKGLFASDTFFCFDLFRHVYWNLCCTIDIANILSGRSIMSD